MKKLIATLDVPTSQVLIEARIVQATRDWSRGLGIVWGGRNNQIRPYNTATQGTNFPDRRIWGVTGISQLDGTDARTPSTDGGVVGLGDIPSLFVMNLATPNTLTGAAIQFGMILGQFATDLDVRLNIGEATGKSKTISRPKVQVMDRRAATIRNGRQIAFQTVSADGTQVQLVNVDLLLTVTPRIYPDGRIEMNLNVTDNDLGPIVNSYTSIITRQANTVMIVKDGETAVIGGILKKVLNAARSGWPGLMNVPVVNLFFSDNSRSEEVTELLVFITPSIVKRPPPAA